MNDLHNLAHAGVEHTSAADAAAHEAGAIIVVTSIAIIIMTLLIRYLTSDNSKDKKPKAKAKSNT